MNGRIEQVTRKVVELAIDYARLDRANTEARAVRDSRVAIQAFERTESAGSSLLALAGLASEWETRIKKIVERIDRLKIDLAPMIDSIRYHGELSEAEAAAVRSVLGAMTTIFEDQLAQAKRPLEKK